MELYELGLLTKEQIGEEAPLGSPKAPAHFAEITARGGKELGQGSKRLCAKYGRPDERQGPGVPGLRFARDWASRTRRRTAARPARLHGRLRGAGDSRQDRPARHQGKADLVKAFQDATGVFDSAGICIFTSFAWGLADVQPQIAAACEGDWSMEKLALVGERIWNMEKQFNLAAGFTKKDDNLRRASPPRRARDRPVNERLREYYKVRGWNEDGAPKRETR